MADISRRGFIEGATTVATGQAIAGQGASQGPIEPTVVFASGQAPDPVLSGDELPTFRFALEASEGRVDGGNSAKEATVKQLPVSKGIAGVSMWLEPGGMRELHWHATAAEWAFVIEGACRTTIIDSEGRSETNDFGPGDVWYFPRGHGHSIQGLGPKACHFILVFDNGYFSEFGTFSVTDWIGHAPPELVAKNLGLSAETIARLPKKEVYFTHGPVPAATAPPAHSGVAASTPLTHRYPLLAQAPHGIYAGGREWRVDQKQFPISKTVAGVVLDLDPGGLRELHWHPNADEWQYVISGTIRVTLFGANGRWKTETLRQGDVGYIPMGYGHSIENVSATEPTRVLIAFNNGDYEAIDLSTWLASNPDALLAQTFGLPVSAIAGLPKKRVFISPASGPK